MKCVKISIEITASNGALISDRKIKFMISENSKPEDIQIAIEHAIKVEK